MRKFALGLLIAGISMITLSLGLTFYSNYTHNKLLSSFSETQSDTTALKDSLAAAKSDVEKDIIPQNAIGIIKIPSINLKFPIMKGIEDNILRQAVGHFPETSELGGNGNSTLIGHNNFILAEPFKNLNSVSIGDDVQIITSKGTFDYVFFDKKITHSNDVSVLEFTDMPQLTVITCTDDAKERLVYKAIAKDLYVSEEAPQTT